MVVSIITGVLGIIGAIVATRFALFEPEFYDPPTGLIGTHQETRKARQPETLPPGSGAVARSKGRKLKNWFLLGISPRTNGLMRQIGLVKGEKNLGPKGQWAD